VRTSIGSARKVDRKNAGDARQDSISEVNALLKYEGFVVFNQRGSHYTFHHANRRLITIVKPHGGRKTCHPGDIKKLLRVLGYENDA
jgi:predicted RNA binding protein YcfA (HicA-like mRNA interferase family)